MKWRAISLLRRVILILLLSSMITGCVVNRWTSLNGPASTASPALSTHVDGKIYAMTITAAGSAQYTSSALPGSWDAWQDIDSTQIAGFAVDTAPVLVRTTSTIFAYARGVDNNLYRATKVAGNQWSKWVPIINDQSILGRFSVAITQARGASNSYEQHVIYLTSSGCRYIRLINGNATLGKDWQGCVEAVIAGDNTGEIAIVGLFADEIRFQVAERSNNWGFRAEQSLSQKGYVLSNLVRLNNSYHIIFANGKLLDDVSFDYRYRLLHFWFDASDEQLQIREVASYTPKENVHALPALSGYRNKLIGVWVLPDGKVYSARWDNADPKFNWINYYRRSAGGEGKYMPALAAYDLRQYVPDSGADAYGDDLFAAIIANKEGGTLEFIIMSRAMMREDISKDYLILNSKSDGLVPECRSQSDPYGPDEVSNIWSDDRIVLTEIGFNLWMLPGWLAGKRVYANLTQHMCTPGVPGFDKEIGCEKNRLPVIIKRSGGLFVCDGAWILRDNSYIKIWEETGHYLVLALGLEKGQYEFGDFATKLTGLPIAVIDEGRSLFSEGLGYQTGVCEPGGSRCPGFTGYGGNYDSGSLSHSFIYTMYYYLTKGDELRQFILDDYYQGNDLLYRKYNWIKENIFNGIEYRNELEPI